MGIFNSGGGPAEQSFHILGGEPEESNIEEKEVPKESFREGGKEGNIKNELMARLDETAERVAAEILIFRN